MVAPALKMPGRAGSVQRVSGQLPCATDPEKVAMLEKANPPKSACPMAHSNHNSCLLVIAASPLSGVLLYPSTVAAEETLQLDVPYLCPDGTTNIVTRCQSNARGEICFWREEKDGRDAWSRAQTPGVLFMHPATLVASSAP